MPSRPMISLPSSSKPKNDGAEALYTNPTPPQGIRLIKQMKELNWNPKITLS